MHPVAARTGKLLPQDFSASAYHTSPQGHITLTQQPQFGHVHVDSLGAILH